MENKPVWNHTQFVRFFKQSPRTAYEYRKNALWYEIPEEYQTVEEKNSIKWVITNEIVNNDIVEVKEEIRAKIVEENSNIEFTREDLISKLETAGIKYMPNSKDETLLKKCIENNLI